MEPTVEMLFVGIKSYLRRLISIVSPQRSGSVSFRVGRRFAPNCRGSVLPALGQPEKSQVLLSEPQSEVALYLGQPFEVPRGVGGRSPRDVGTGR
jgi:hypothetical protein